MSSSERNTKIYGAVETETFITFEGFCKKIYNTEKQEIEVFIDDKKVDKILANQKIPTIEDTYEVFDTEGFCFTYKLPKEYIGEKHKLEFKTIDGEQLIHSPITTLNTSDEKYNKSCFIESLNEPINEEKFVDIYGSDIGFFGIEENLNDKDFIDYIKELNIRFSSTVFKAFCFNDDQVKLIKSIFGDTFKILKVVSIDDILNSIGIYLCNGNYNNDYIIYQKIKTFIYPIYINIEYLYKSFSKESINETNEKMKKLQLKYKLEYNSTGRQTYIFIIDIFLNESTETRKKIIQII